MKPLDKEILQERLSSTDWVVGEEALQINLKFKDFSQALAFIVRVGMLAEKNNHHPHIENTYNSVVLELSTHDAGNKVTEKDLGLALEIQKLL